MVKRKNQKYKKSESIKKNKEVVLDDEIALFHISTKKFDILKTLKERGILRQFEIGEIINLTQSTVKNHLEELEEEGYIQMRQIKRKKLIQITDKGISAVEKYEEFRSQNLISDPKEKYETHSKENEQEEKFKNSDIFQNEITEKIVRMHQTAIGFKRIAEENEKRSKPIGRRDIYEFSKDLRKQCEEISKAATKFQETIITPSINNKKKGREQEEELNK
jgi:DNA-binding MarR family transcriptional regulator